MNEGVAKCDTINKQKMLRRLKLDLEIIEEPKGVFTAQIHEVRGAIVQEKSELLAIKKVFKQAWICIEVDSANFNC